MVLAITYASLMDVPETPIDDVRFIDKWVHIVMYGVLSAVLWFEYSRRKERSRRLFTMPSALLCWLFPLLWGGLMELLQAYCTNGHRSGDWLDFIANGTGATLVLFVVFAYAKLRRNT